MIASTTPEYGGGLHSADRQSRAADLSSGKRGGRGDDFKEDRREHAEQSQLRHASSTGARG